MTYTRRRNRASLHRLIAPLVAAALVITGCTTTLSGTAGPDPNPFGENDHGYPGDPGVPLPPIDPRVFHLDPPFDQVDTLDPRSVAGAAIATAFDWSNTTIAPEKQLMAITPLFDARLKSEWEPWGPKVAFVNFRLWDKWAQDGMVFTTAAGIGDSEAHPADTDTSWARKLIATVTGRSPQYGQVTFIFVVVAELVKTGRWQVHRFDINDPVYTAEGP